MTDASPLAVIVMGPAGAGKTTVGSALAAELGWRFVDADALHPVANVEKMRRGIGLTDADREPWLEAVREVLVGAADRKEPLVVACSALKRRYRDLLGHRLDHVRYVFLRADEELLRQRVLTRPSHYAGEVLVTSQVQDLEPPGTEALTLDAAAPPPVLVRAIRDEWGL